MNNVLQHLPLNIGLLILKPEHTRGMRQVKVLDIFEGGGSKSFHPDGLFSTETFGKVGEEKRNRMYGFIDLHAGVFHPTIFKALLDLKELYGGIMAGTAYAKFDQGLRDFVPANAVEGETGFEFFFKHFKELKFEERPSTSREFAIKMIAKYKDESVMDKFLVMPAGLRDFTILENGKPEEDEINGLYRRLISIANVIGSAAKADHSHLDAIRYSMQKEIVVIYDYILNLLKGKSKLIQGWWTSRRVFHSTRNVITSNVSKTKVLFDELTVGPNHTVVGLYQTLRSIFPLAVNLIRGIASDVFTGPNTPANLIDKKTLERVTVSVSPERYDEWMTQEGIESVMGRFEAEGLRHEEIEIEGHYFALVYNDGKVVKLCHGAEELPEGFDKKYLKPITYAEFYYLAILEKARGIPGFVTRYPITGFGSIYPSWIYLKTTTRSQSLRMLDENWQPTGSIANEFPLRGVPFVNSMSPSILHLLRLTADFDGDMCSFTAVLTVEGIEEIRNLLNNKDYYVGVDGKMAFSSSNDISDLIFAELSAVPA